MSAPSGKALFAKAWIKAIQQKIEARRNPPRERQYYVLVNLSDQEHEWIHEQADAYECSPGAIVERAIRLHIKHWDNIGQREMTQMLCAALSGRS